MNVKEKVTGDGDQSSGYQIILKSAHIFNHDESVEADIIIDDGIIRKIGRNISTYGENIKIINCKGKYVMPGGIDVNTHFLGKSKNIISVEDFYNGTGAALSGGTTTIINTVEVENESDSLIHKVNEIREMADSQVCCDYGLHVGIKSFNEQTILEMPTLVNEYGINSFKINLSDENCNLHDDRNLYDLFKFSKKIGAVLLVNSLNGHLVDKKANDVFQLGIIGPEGHRYACNEELESDSVHHIITLANETNCPIVFTNIMSQEAAELVSTAKGRNSIVYGEVITASLAIDSVKYNDRSWDQAAAFITDPPLSRDVYTAKRLIQHLASGGLDITSSNHCKFTIPKKQTGLGDFRKIPSGITGVTERMMVVWDKGVNVGIFDACRFVAVTSSNAARIFNLYPRKGAIKEGSDADIVIWDSKIVRKLATESNEAKCFENIYENIRCFGAPEIVLSNGKIVYENNSLDVKAGSGRFIKLHPNPEFIYKRVFLKDKLYIQSLKQIIRDPIVSKEEDVPINPTITNNNSDVGIRINQRAFTRCGGRNMQDSTFSLSGSQIDDNKPVRASIRAQQPPGGVSSYPW